MQGDAVVHRESLTQPRTLRYMKRVAFTEASSAPCCLHCAPADTALHSANRRLDPWGLKLRRHSLDPLLHPLPTCLASILSIKGQSEHNCLVSTSFKTNGTCLPVPPWTSASRLHALGSNTIQNLTPWHGIWERTCLVCFQSELKILFHVGPTVMVQWLSVAL